MVFENILRNFVYLTLFLGFLILNISFFNFETIIYKPIYFVILSQNKNYVRINIEYKK